jgi:hypothetical protein
MRKAGMEGEGGEARRRKKKGIDNEGQREIEGEGLLHSSS